MAMIQITFRVRLRWWLKPWVRAVILIHRFTGWAPKETTRDAIIRRGIRLERVACPT